MKMSKCGRCGQVWDLADCCPDPDFGELCAPCSEAEAETCLENALALLARTPDPNSLVAEAPKHLRAFIR